MVEYNLDWRVHDSHDPSNQDNSIQGWSVYKTNVRQQPRSKSDYTNIATFQGNTTTSLYDTSTSNFNIYRIRAILTSNEVPAVIIRIDRNNLGGIGTIDGDAISAITIDGVSVSQLSIDGDIVYDSSTSNIPDYLQWNNYNPSPPVSYTMTDGGYMDAKIIETSSDNLSTLYLDQDGADDSGTDYKSVEKSYYVPGKSTLHYKTNFSPDGPYDQFQVDVNGTTILSLDSGDGHGWTNRQYDIGAREYVSVEFGHNVSRNSNRRVESKIRELHFK